MAVNGRVQRRLRVNPALCDGYGYCFEIVPELIAQDDWGFPIVASAPIGDPRVEGLAQKAVATCPRQALIFEEVRDST